MSAWRLRSAAEDVKKTGLAIYAMIPLKNSAPINLLGVYSSRNDTNGIKISCQDKKDITDKARSPVYVYHALFEIYPIWYSKWLNT
jgi:hypothetical protein